MAASVFIHIGIFLVITFILLRKATAELTRIETDCISCLNLNNTLFIKTTWLPPLWEYNCVSNLNFSSISNYSLIVDVLCDSSDCQFIERKKISKIFDKSKVFCSSDNNFFKNEFHHHHQQFSPYFCSELAELIILFILILWIKSETGKLYAYIKQVNSNIFIIIIL